MPNYLFLNPLGDVPKKSLKALMPNEVWSYLEIDDDEVKEILDESLYVYDDLSEDDIEEQYTMEGETNPEMKVIVTDRDNVALPTTTITCYKCGGTKGYWWTVQTRSADEAPTNFIRCAKCGNTWRSSN